MSCQSVFQIIFVCMISKSSLIKVLRSDSPDNDHTVTMDGSSLSSYDEFTICARFKTHQFSLPKNANPEQLLISYYDGYGSINSVTILGSFSAYNCDPHPFYPNNDCTSVFQGFVGNIWKYGKTYGYLKFDPRVPTFYYDSWKPQIWKSFCAIASSKEKFYKAFIDNELIYEYYDYSGSHKHVNKNVTLMNKFDGQFTDFNIWDRILSENDLQDWQNCNFRSKSIFRL